ncbi:MAG: SulP family inorganic anion transporter, partial [Planctomycetota bacterium]
MFSLLVDRQSNAKNDILSGITVALALVPEAIAFAFVAGVSPLIGLYSAFFIGLITAAIGGRPGMISGATGAMAVVIVTLVAKHGIAYLFPTVILCGLFQIAIGTGRLGKFIRMVPHPVMLGFVNGLAIVIGLAQLESFKTLGVDGKLEFLSGASLALMLGLVGLTMAVIHFLPKFTRAVPASLAAIALVTFVGIGMNWFWPTQTGGNRIATVGDLLRDKTIATRVAELTPKRDPVQADVTFVSTAPTPSPSMERLDVKTIQSQLAADPAASGIKGGLPKPFFWDHALVPLNWETLRIIFPYAFILCGVGLIESLMTLTLI